jgi:hypothetical protein
MINKQTCTGFMVTLVLGGSAEGGKRSVSRVQAPCADVATAAAADSLAAKFNDHQFIFLGSTHGDVKIEEFLMCLVSRPTFTRRVTDIVSEDEGSGFADHPAGFAPRPTPSEPHGRR